MNDRRVREALEAAARDDDDGARERSWQVVQAAYAGHEPGRRPRRWAPLAAAAALIPVAAVGVAAASAPDSGVGRWVRSVLGVGAKHARPALERVPGGGRLLVEAGGSAWVVGSDGTKRRLGAYSGVSWSPRGRFVAGWRGRELSALDPGGRVRWSLARPAPVTAVRWGPIDGFRVAYVTGAQLRVVNGDGTGDRGFAQTRGALAPAWRPDATHVLAYGDARGRVVVAAVDSGRRLWRTGPIADARELAWSPAADRLLVVTRRQLLLFDGSGRLVAGRPFAAGFVVTGAEWSPRGRAIALVAEDAKAGRTELILVDAAPGLGERLLFTGPGRFGAPAWSPDATRLLLPWPDADQWLFLSPRGRARLVAVANIASQFTPGSDSPSFPRSAQWCCAPPPGPGAAANR